MFVHLEVAHPASDRTQPSIISAKLVELALSSGHLPCWALEGGKGTHRVTRNRAEGEIAPGPDLIMLHGVRDLIQ